MLTDCLNCKAMVRLHWWGEACGACGTSTRTPLGKAAEWCRAFLFDSDFGNRRGILSSLRDLPSGIDHAVRAGWRRWKDRNEVDALQGELRMCMDTNAALWRSIGEKGGENMRLTTERDHWFNETARYRDMLHNAHAEVVRLEVDRGEALDWVDTLRSERDGLAFEVEAARRGCARLNKELGTARRDLAKFKAIDLAHAEAAIRLFREIEEIVKAIDGHDEGYLRRWVTTLKQSDGEGWAIGEMVERYLSWEAARLG